MNTQETIYLSNCIVNAQRIEQVVELVNEGTCEGIEGIEFTSEMLAGCYIYNACEYDRDEDEREAHAEFLIEAGANFDLFDALEYAAELEAAK